MGNSKRLRIPRGVQLQVPTLEQCRAEVAAKRVTERRDGPHSIFNYRACVHYDDSLWNPINRACRGLIFDVVSEKPVAVPFPKFFNVGQMPESSPERLAGLELIHASHKFDGCLGIVWWDSYRGKARLVTRGTFDSVQGKAGDEMLKGVMSLRETPDLLKIALKQGFTFLCEIIDPATKVVVNYDYEALVGIARVSPDHVLDFHLSDWPATWPIAMYNGLSVEDSLKLATEVKSQEGWVFAFSDGTMVKVKTDEYRKLHRLVAGVNKRRVWEVLRDGGTIEEDWAGLPDEYMEEAKAWELELNKAHAKEKMAFYGAIRAPEPFWTRKDAALWAKKNLPAKWLHWYFADLSGKPVAPFVWEHLKPPAEKTS